MTKQYVSYPCSLLYFLSLTLSNEDSLVDVRQTLCQEVVVLDEVLHIDASLLWLLSKSILLLLLPGTLLLADLETVKDATNLILVLLLLNEDL